MTKKKCLITVFLFFCAFYFTDKVNGNAYAWMNDRFDVKLENIERVHYHEGASFTYWQRIGDTHKIIPIRFNHSWWSDEKTKIEVLDDLKPDEKIWAIEKGSGADPHNHSSLVEYIEIHVHSMKEIQGGGWSHGKFGSGTTTDLE